MSRNGSHAATPERILVKTDDGVFELVSLAAVRFVAADNGGARLHCPGRSYSLPLPMKGVERALGDAGFVRIHKSHLVNLDHVASIESIGNGAYQVRLSSGETLRMSRTFGQRFFERFTLDG